MGKREEMKGSEIRGFIAAIVISIKPTRQEPNDWAEELLAIFIFPNLYLKLWP